ncbi:hypothetical protein Srut_39150 [Streptomyces rutgersensis]|nr:hypothetical protein Srut_39150 [Streptomyces rutgersensis]
MAGVAGRRCLQRGTCQKIGGLEAVMESSVDRIGDPWGGRVPYGRHERWPVRVDTFLADGVEPSMVQQWVQAASILHSDGDAMDIAVVDGRMAGVRGRAVDRVNRGRLGPKDLFGWQANASPDRLTRPLVREGGRLVECDWETAMGRVVARSRELLTERGPGSLGFYTSGQLFLEEYYTLAVLARAGVGTNHLDGNTRLCTSTAAEALKETFGCDGQPGSYDDIDHADVIALFGHNLAETQPVQWMRILDRLEGAEPPRLLCVDPRPTQVARKAAVHLAPCRHQRRTAQRPAARDHPERPRRPRVRPGAHGRVRGARRPGRGVHPGVGGRHL